MLTYREQRALLWIYTISCKFYTAPFTWKDGRMFVKLSHRFRFWDYFTKILILITLIFQFVDFGIVVKEKNINGSVLSGTILISHLALALFKLNLEMFQSEMVHLLNQLFYMNSAWGNRSLYVTDTIYKTIHFHDICVRLIHVFM